MCVIFFSYLSFMLQSLPCAYPPLSLSPLRTQSNKEETDQVNGSFITLTQAITSLSDFGYKLLLKLPHPVVWKVNTTVI